MQAVIATHQSFKISYIDQALSEALLRQALQPEQVVRAMLEKSTFPIVSMGIDLETHDSHQIRFARTDDDPETEPTPHLIVAGSTNSGKSMYAKLLITQIMNS